MWVIAETTDLPTKFAKVVVTDDQGRYVIPELPNAKYKVWVRGYGLVDSAKVDGEPGKTLNLTAVKAPGRKGRRGILPRHVLVRDDQRAGGQRIPRHRRQRQRHPGGDEGAVLLARYREELLPVLPRVRRRRASAQIPEFWQKLASQNSTEAWALRTQSGQAMNNMALGLGRIGADKAYAIFADWTDRVAAGEVPADQAAASAGRRAQRRHHDVGLVNAEALPA